MSGVPFHAESTVNVARAVVEGLEAGQPATSAAIASLPLLISKLRGFGADADLIARLEAVYEARRA